MYIYIYIAAAAKARSEPWPFCLAPHKQSLQTIPASSSEIGRRTEGEEKQS